MDRRLFTTGLAVAALFGALMTLVALRTGRAAPERPPPELGAGEAPPPAERAATPPPRAAAWVGPMKLRASGWNAPAADPSSSPMASRVVRKVVRKGLLAAPFRSRLARCADRAGGFGGAARRGPIPRPKPAVLVLELEARGGEVRIVSAEVQTWGEASAASVSCARNVLEGHVVRALMARQEPAPGQPEPERMRMPFPLNPGSEVVASSR